MQNMYEGLYTPLTDEQIDKYLERIEMPRPEKLDKEYLDKLVLNHQTHVVFENIDVCDYHRPLSLNIADLFNKIVERHRGGYCFELNGLFIQLLKGLGYEAWSSPCRGIGADITMPGAVMHRGNTVRIDGKLYFCDVGYGGPMPPGAIEFVADIRQVVDGETFWFEPHREYWWLMKRLTKGTSESGMLGPYDPNTINDIKEVDVMLISPQKWEAADFVGPNETMSEGPNAGFSKMHMVSLRTPTGSKGLNDTVFTVIENGVRTRTPITKEDIPGILKEHFNITPEQ